MTNANKQDGIAKSPFMQLLDAPNEMSTHGAPTYLEWLQIQINEAGEAWHQDNTDEKMARYVEACNAKNIHVNGPY